MRKRKERRERSKTQRLNSNKHVEESILPTNEDRQEEAEAEPQAEEEEEEVEATKGFFACYLLCSLNPRFRGQTYIGFTVNPRRRIRQHNGEISSGAWRTKSKRPWEMILCIYGFPRNVSALQFEWAWQHPIESLAVRKAAADFKSLSGIANKIKLAYTMLTLPPWQSLKLTVNFFSTKYMKHGAGCPSLPKQIKVQFSLMDELPCYTNFDHCLDEDDELNGDASPLHSTSVYQGQMTWDETNTARHTEDTHSLNGGTSVYEDQMTWDETNTARHTEDTLSLNGEDHTSPFHTSSLCRDETDTITQTQDKFSLNGNDTRLPLDLVDSPPRTPSSSSACFGNRIGSVAEDPQGLIQDNCHDLGQENKQPTKSHVSSSELGFVQPNHKSRREAGKRQFLIVDSPEEAAFSSVFDMANSVEEVHNRDFLGLIEENSNKVGESPMHQLESSSFATKDQLPSTNNVRSFAEVDVIDILTPSSNSITRYFRKKKRSSLVCNNNDIIDLTRSPSFIQL